MRSLAGSWAVLGLSGCGVFGDDAPALPPAGTIGRAALLAPLTGSRAGIGQIMQETAALGNNNPAELFVIDSGDTAEQAVSAAQTALADGARMIVGPLFSAQTRPVAEAVGGSVPVLALTNDSSVGGGNLFVFGITPDQSAKSTISFAASRGLRTIAIVVPPGRFGTLSIAAARNAAADQNINLLPPITAPSATGLAENLRQAGNGALPDAVYLPVVGGPFEAQAQAVAAAGIQILGSNQWSAISPGRLPALEGAWFSAPDPVRFEAFATALQDQSGADAGVVAGLTFDAIETARQLGRIGQQSRDGVLREAGFDGVLGRYRFTQAGQCERGLAILKVSAGATNLIGTTPV